MKLKCTHLDGPLEGSTSIIEAHTAIAKALSPFFEGQVAYFVAYFKGDDVACRYEPAATVTRYWIRDKIQPDAKYVSVSKEEYERVENLVIPDGKGTGTQFRTWAVDGYIDEVPA